jgi:hypothetical protein
MRERHPRDAMVSRFAQQPRTLVATQVTGREYGVRVGNKVQYLSRRRCAGFVEGSGVAVVDHSSDPGIQRLWNT